MARAYLLTETKNKIIQGRGWSLICARCGKPIRIGDKIITIRRYSKCKTKLAKRYHKACFEEMFV